MTVRQIALSAAAILQADDIETALAVSDEQEDAGVIDDADVLTLIKCVNLAAAELAADMPVLHTVSARAENGVIAPNSFDGTVTAIKSVTHGGHNVPFTFTSRGVGVRRDGEYVVTYVKQYEDAAVDSEIELGAGADSQTLGYLTARNYCLVTGRTDEAAIWDQRYNAEAEKKRMARRSRLPKRSWM